MRRTAPLWQWLGANWRELVLPSLAALLLLYTADQLFTGERGIVTWRVMHSQITGLNDDVTRLNAEIERLNGNIDRLKGLPQANGSRGAPDKDFIDELLRRDLGVLKTGEAVILVTPTTPLSD
jgi:cell division protein FtsB